MWALLALVQLPIALCQALYIILTVHPKVIIGVGGYGAFGPLWWGVIFRIPIFLHEQNLFPGLVTRLFAPFARTVFLTYPQTARWLRARRLTVTGLPVRPEILAATPDPERFGLQPGVKTVLVLGGSRGSRLLTERALAIRHHTKIKKEVQFLVVTGDRGAIFDDGGARTVLVPYIHEMGTALATADLVISRAGATTLAELAALRKPAIIVPWKDAAADHQTANAQAQVGQCFSILPESQLSPDKLVEAIAESLHKTTVSSSSSLQRQKVATHGDQALIHILHEVLLDAHSADSTTALHRYRWRWHERFGESLP